MTQREYPASFVRGGTSKGLFFRAADLPASRAAIEPILLAALGSPDPYGRQLDGMGGGISSLSKAMIVARSARPHVDVDYTFAQVGVRRAEVDWAGNCGNLTSAIGPFAIEARLVTAGPDGERHLRLYNTNTGKRIDARFPVRGGAPEVRGEQALPGVAGCGAPIRLDFLDPGGSVTGRLLPSGAVVDHLDVAGEGRIEASLVDASNPCVFVAAERFGVTATELPAALDADRNLMVRLERVRRAAAVAMDMTADPEHAPPAVPKIALVAAAARSATLDGGSIEPADADLLVRFVSMGDVHRAAPLTGALCTAVACGLPGTLPAALARTANGEVRIATPSGVIRVAAAVVPEGNGWRAERASVFRTARTLMRGSVCVPA